MIHIEAYRYINLNNRGEDKDKAGDISRFLEAQENSYSGYEAALEEIRSGRKESHWIWYIFPQLKGLGHSRMANFYGISGRQEAEDYLRHPVLGERLREITRALLEHEGENPKRILGNIDAMKVKSCMTLFDCIQPDDVFARVLDAFYEGKRDLNSIVR